MGLLGSHESANENLGNGNGGGNGILIENAGGNGNEGSLSENSQSDAFSSPSPIFPNSTDAPGRHAAGIAMPKRYHVTKGNLRDRFRR